jgi:hypothetical protein
MLHVCDPLQDSHSSQFLSNKDKTPAKYQSSVVYEFTCPGCKSRYIGKTDRCFYTRIKEHSLDNKSEVFNHITPCEHFQHIKSILELYPDEETNPTSVSTCKDFSLQKEISLFARKNARK